MICVAFACILLLCLWQPARAFSIIPETKQVCIVFTERDEALLYRENNAAFAQAISYQFEHFRTKLRNEDQRLQEEKFKQLDPATQSKVRNLLRCGQDVCK